MWNGCGSNVLGVPVRGIRVPLGPKPVGVVGGVVTGRVGTVPVRSGMILV